MPPSAPGRRLGPAPSPLHLLSRIPSHPLRSYRRHPLSPSASRRRPRSLHRAVASAFIVPGPRPPPRGPPRPFLFPAGSSSSGRPSRPSSYIANHTYVQTRYILLTAPGLTIVILLLIFAASPRTGRILYIAALAAALAVSLVEARPFIRNKEFNCQITQDLASLYATASRRTRPLPLTPSARSPSPPSTPSSTSAESLAQGPSRSSPFRPRPCCSGPAPRARNTTSPVFSPCPKPPSYTPATSGSLPGQSTPRSIPHPPQSTSGSSLPPPPPTAERSLSFPFVILAGAQPRRELSFCPWA